MGPIYSSWAATNTTATTSNLWYTTSSPAVYYNDPLTFRYEPYQVPAQELAKVKPWDEAAAIPESDMAWLKRRVDEISWVPA